MSKNFRAILFLICAVQTFFALAFFFQWTWAVNLWPYPGTTPLTFIFVASIFAAAAASTFWATATHNYGALAGIALDYIIILIPVSIYSFQLAVSSDNPRLTLYGFLCLLGVLFGLGYYAGAFASRWIKHDLCLDWCAAHLSFLPSP